MKKYIYKSLLLISLYLYKCLALDDIETGLPLFNTYPYP
jgi:hypothetical protein